MGQATVYVLNYNLVVICGWVVCGVCWAVVDRHVGNKLSFLTWGLKLSFSGVGLETVFFWRGVGNCLFLMWGWKLSFSGVGLETVFFWRGVANRLF
jgi:hypothetical protein